MYNTPTSTESCSIKTSGCQLKRHHLKTDSYMDRATNSIKYVSKGVLRILPSVQHADVGNIEVLLQYERQ